MTLIAPLGSDGIGPLYWSLHVRDVDGVDAPELQTVGSGAWRVFLVEVVEALPRATRERWLEILGGWLELDRALQRPIHPGRKDTAPRLRHRMIARERAAASVAAGMLRVSLAVERRIA